MTTPLDGVRSASSVRAESSETTLTVVMGDDSPLPKKRPVTAPPSGSSSRQYYHIEVETEKHRPDCARGSHKPHQGECRHPDAVVAARASLIAKERMKLDYCEDSGDDVSRTTMPDEESAKRNATEAADKATSAVDKSGAEPGKATGGAAGSAPANKFTLNDPHVVVRPSRKGMRLNDPDDFFKSSSPPATREEVDTTPLLPVRRTSSMAMTPTPRENTPPCRPSSGHQRIHASRSRSSKCDTKTSTSDRQLRAPANTRATTPASTRPSTHGKTAAGSTVASRTNSRRILRVARNVEASESVLCLTRATRSSSTHDGLSQRTTASTFRYTPTPTPSTSSSTPQSTSGCILARYSARKCQKKVKSAPSSKQKLTPVTSTHVSSKGSTQRSAPSSIRVSTPTIRPGSFPGSSSPSIRKIKEPENKTSDTPIDRKLSPPASMRPNTDLNKLQNITSLPHGGNASVSASTPSWSRALAQAEWNTPTQSTLIASMPTLPSLPENSPENVPGNVPANTLGKMPQKPPPQSTNEPPKVTSNSPENLVIGTPECSPNSVIECSPENQGANTPDDVLTTRPVKKQQSQPSSGPGSNAGSLQTNKRANNRTNIPPACTSVNSPADSPETPPENSRYRPGCARERSLQNKRKETHPGGLSRALQNKLGSLPENNDSGSDFKSPHASARSSTRISGTKRETNTRFSTIPEANDYSERIQRIVLLLDTDAFFGNSLSM